MARRAGVPAPRVPGGGPDVRRIAESGRSHCRPKLVARPRVRGVGSRHARHRHRGNTAMFALIQGVLMRPLPVREQDRLLVAWTQPRGGGFNHVPYVTSEHRTHRPREHAARVCLGRQLQRHGAVHRRGRRRCRVHRRRRSRRRLLRRARRRTDAWTRADARGRSHRLRRRRGHRSPVVEAALWRLAGGDRPPAHDLRTAVHDRRRDAAGHRVSATRAGLDSRWRSVTRARLPRIRTFASMSISSRGCGRACLSRRPRRNCRH